MPVFVDCFYYDSLNQKILPMIKIKIKSNNQPMNPPQRIHKTARTICKTFFLAIAPPNL